MPPLAIKIRAPIAGSLLVLALLLIPTGTVQAGSNPSDGTTFARLLDLPGGGETLNLSLSPLVATYRSGDTVDLGVQTPDNPASAASNITVEAGSGLHLWNWSGRFGYQSGFSGGGELSADNSTVDGEVAIPSSAVSNATLIAGSLGAPLTGDYSVGVSLGGTSLFNIQGASKYEAFSTLPWGTSANDLAQIAIGPDNSSGDSLLATGDDAGNIALYAIIPGLPGQLVYSTQLLAGEPITAIAVAQLFPYGPPDVIAASGTELALIQSNDTIDGTWQEINLDISPSASAGTSVESIVPVGSVEGRPGFLAGTNNGWIFVCDWSGTRWESPLPQLESTGNPSPVHLVSWESPDQYSMVLATSGDSVEAWNLSSQSPTLVLQQTLNGSSDLTDPIVDHSGSAVVFASNSGSVYEENLGQPSSPVLTYSSSVPVVGLASSSLDPTSAAYLSLDNGSVLVLGSPFSLGASPLVFLPTHGTLGVAPAIGSVSQASSADILVPNGPSLQLAISTVEFTRTSVGTWQSALNQFLGANSPTYPRSGASFRVAPIRLDAQGGTVELQNVLEYNLSVSVDVTAALSASLESSSRSGSPSWLEIASGGPGFVYLTVSVLPPIQSSPSIWNSLSQWASHVLGPSLLYIAAGVAIAGAVLLGLGYGRYWLSRPRSATLGRTPPRRTPDQPQGVRPPE